MAQVQQGQMNKFISQKSVNMAVLKDNPLFYLRPCIFVLADSKSLGFCYELLRTETSEIQVDHLNSLICQWLGEHLKGPSHQITSP